MAPTDPTGAATAPSRRRALTQRIARTAAVRLALATDPDLGRMR